LIGAQDGAGSIVADDGKRPRPIPIARGRVDWLGDGTLHVAAGPGAFGRALLVEVRNLVKPAGLGRTLGDRVLLQNELVAVYEEILAPSELRPMHHHGPRFVLSVTDIDLMTTLPSGEKRPAKRDAGYVSWTPAVVTHDVLNIAKQPFWCVCVEGA
jgi:hypothetical protein